MDRRKLLRGGLSAPLVMTVTPVLGAARTTFTACLNNGASQPVPTVAPGAAHQDEWLRVDLNIFEVELTDGEGKLVKQAGRYFIGPDGNTMYRLADLNPESVPASMVQDFNAQTLGLKRKQVEIRKALAYVDETGQKTGYAWQPRGGKHVTASCYASVLGSKPGKGIGRGRA